MAINKDLKIMMLQNMLRIRNFEEKVKELFQKDLIRGFIKEAEKAEKIYA